MKVLNTVAASALVIGSLFGAAFAQSPTADRDVVHFFDLNGRHYAVKQSELRKAKGCALFRLGTFEKGRDCHPRWSKERFGSGAAGIVSKVPLVGKWVSGGCNKEYQHVEVRRFGDIDTATLRIRHCKMLAEDTGKVLPCPEKAGHSYISWTKHSDAKNLAACTGIFPTQ